VRWVLKVVQDGVESDLVPAVTDGSLQPDHWYQLDLVVGLSKVTLYADGQEKIAWQRGSSPRLTGSRVGVATREGIAEFQELELWAVGPPGSRSRAVTRSTRSAKANKGSGGLRAL